MKCNDCRNFSVKVERTVGKGQKQNSGTCSINNEVCDPNGECKTGLFDKTGAI